MVYTRKLGKSNITVSALGMGCWKIGGPFKNQEGQYLAKNKRVIPIPGAKTVEYIIENAKTLESGPISQNFMREIDSLFKELHYDFSYDNFEYYKTK